MDPYYNNLMTHIHTLQRHNSRINIISCNASYQVFMVVSIQIAVLPWI
jgi:hypothetical protein